MRWKTAGILTLAVPLFVAAVTSKPPMGGRDATGLVQIASADPPGWPVSGDRSGWLPWVPPLDDFAGSAVDMSRFLDPPAGKHGFIRIRANAPATGPMLEFADGTPARFFGINVLAEANFFSHDYADFLATRLASAGCNLVRMHQIDAGWAQVKVFDPSY